MATYLERLAKANALDKAEGEYVTHRGDAVVCEMLQKAFGPEGAKARQLKQEQELKQQRQIIKAQQLARANRMFATRASAAQAPRKLDGQGMGGLKAKNAPTVLLVKSGSAKARRRNDDAKVATAAALGGAMSAAQAEAAINDAVVRGKISGTDALALLQRIRAKG
ncbi:MAG: hypothetical protein C5B56_05290 [Proteobacteria bacterium]|nr:MAG: hypothetical protein C5B56_05290 [Pseudomonadota bacterium]